MAKPNYQGEKRRRDLEKKAKKEAKRLRKLDPSTPADTASADAPATAPDPA